jgi:hypothetical protein
MYIEPVGPISNVFEYFLHSLALVVFLPRHPPQLGRPKRSTRQFFTSFTHKLEVNVEHTPVGLVLLDGGLSTQANGTQPVGAHVVARPANKLAHVIDGKDFRIKGPQ